MCWCIRGRPMSIRGIPCGTTWSPCRAIWTLLASGRRKARKTRHRRSIRWRLFSRDVWWGRHKACRMCCCLFPLEVFFSVGSRFSGKVPSRISFLWYSSYAQASKNAGSVVWWHFLYEYLCLGFVLLRILRYWKFISMSQIVKCVLRNTNFSKHF